MPPPGAAFDLDLSGIQSDIVKRGYAYWRDLCAGRLPSRAMFDPAAIPAQLPLAADGKHVDMVLVFVDFPRMR